MDDVKYNFKVIFIRYDYKTNHRKPSQTTPNYHKPPQTTTKWHKSPQTTTNHHQNLGRLVVKTVESRQTTANHRKPLQTTTRIRIKKRLIANFVG